MFCRNKRLIPSQPTYFDMESAVQVGSDFLGGFVDDPIIEAEFQRVALDEHSELDGIGPLPSGLVTRMIGPCKIVGYGSGDNGSTYVLAQSYEDRSLHIIVPTDDGVFAAYGRTPDNEPIDYTHLSESRG